jgi:lipopolysaccharide/colanic/teichoic acid biosynthesis glycosyltransferase
MSAAEMRGQAAGAARRARVAKRLLDVVGAGLGLVLTSPLLVGIAAVVKLSSPGPVLYRWRVVGQHGRPFIGYKFRTMVPNADALRPALAHANEMRGPVFKMRNDPRVTPVGRFLRRYSLDELPQLWSVLKGDMSLVGPRPIRPRFFEELAAELPAYWQRLVVRPGLTGFAQVRRGYETSMAEKLAHDLEWIADRSVRLYLRTLGATTWRVVGQSVRRTST